MFDLDNTLVDRRSAVRTLANELYESDLLDKRSLAAKDAIRIFEDLDQCDNANDKVRFFRWVLDAWGPMNRTPEELADWYQSAPRNWYHPNLEIEQFLDQISSGGIVWGIVTNGPASQIEKANLMRVDAGAKCILVSHIYGASKPSPSIFLEALHQLDDAMPADVLFVGDDPYTDILGASRIGMATTWIRHQRPWPRSLAPPDYVLNSVIEVRRLLAL